MSKGHNSDNIFVYLGPTNPATAGTKLNARPGARGDQIFGWANIFSHHGRPAGDCKKIEVNPICTLSHAILTKTVPKRKPVCLIKAIQKYRVFPKTSRLFLITEPSRIAMFSIRSHDVAYINLLLSACFISSAKFSTIISLLNSVFYFTVQ